jgi:hypothetical protein
MNSEKPAFMEAAKRGRQTMSPFTSTQHKKLFRRGEQSIMYRQFKRV